MKKQFTIKDEKNVSNEEIKAIEMNDMRTKIPFKIEKDNWSKMSIQNKNNVKGEVKRCKAKLVAKGDKQQQGIHYVNKKLVIVL